jgi:hypothetical protein
MAKPSVTLRTTKGSALTFAEADANFTNLRDATISVTDGTNSTPIDLNGQITFSAGAGISVANAGGTLTITNTRADTDTTNFNIGNGSTSFNVSDSETVNIAAGTGISVSVNTGTNTLTIANTITDTNTSFTVAGDSGSSQSITQGNTLTISGGTGLSSVASATDTITVNLDNTAVTAGTYEGRFTVDAQGRITAADNTVDGTNAVGFRGIPISGTEKTTSYTLTTSDKGEYIQVGSGGSITVPNSTFSTGDVVVVYNNHTAAVTITLSTTNAYIAGTNTNKTSVSLATRGICNILFVSSTVAILTGNIS